MSAGEATSNEHRRSASSPPGGHGTRRVLVGLAVAAVLAVGFPAAHRMLQGQPAPQMESMPGMESQAPPAPSGASSSAVFIPAARQQLIGVRTGVVEHQRAEGTTRTVGVLAYDETRTTHIHVKVAGWVEQLFVDFVGKPVHRGQALFSVYSPDLVAAESDYLVALRTRRELAGGSLQSANAASDALVNAARERLRRWDVSDAEISRLESSGEVTKTVTLYSPFDGVVLERMTFAGQYVTPDMNTFKVADLSTIWVLGEAFEIDAPRVRVHAPIDVEFPNELEAKPVHALIDFVAPDIDPQTRRIRFRASLPNPGQKLRPDTYVTVVLHGEAIDRLVVPREAVIDTGDRKYALLALPDGYFDPRDVEVGPPLGGLYPVVSGLREGDRVVTSAQFLVDSETNLMSAMQNMSMTMPGMDMGPKKPSPAPTTAPVPSPAPSPPAPPMPGMQMAPPPPSPTPSPSAPPHHHVPGMQMPGMPGM